MTRFVWPIMFGVAVLAGTWITEHRSKDRTLARRTCLLAVAGGILGARVWYSAQYGLGSSGMSAWGFVLAAATVAVLYRRLHEGRWQLGDLPDAAAPAFLVGASVVRVGCFLHGCCYGKPTALPWAVTYAPSTPAFRAQLQQGLINVFASSSLPVHPTQLYEAFFTAALGATIVLRGPRLRLPRHCLFLLTAASYATFRFFVEFLRGDSGGLHFGPLTFAQGTSIVALLVSLLALRRWMRWEQPVKQETEVA